MMELPPESPYESFGANPEPGDFRPAAAGDVPAYTPANAQETAFTPANREQVRIDLEHWLAAAMPNLPEDVRKHFAVVGHPDGNNRIPQEARGFEVARSIRGKSPDQYRVVLTAAGFRLVKRPTQYDYVKEYDIRETTLDEVITRYQATGGAYGQGQDPRTLCDQLTKQIQDIREIYEREFGRDRRR